MEKIGLFALKKERHFSGQRHGRGIENERPLYIFLYGQEDGRGREKMEIIR